MTQDFDPLIDQRPARYAVGIDLGTTNSAVAYVDTEATKWRVRILPVPQLVAPALVEARDTLPSFHYEAAAGEAAHGALRLPWQSTDPDHAVGVFARDQGCLSPGRLIASAKSWLCHSGVDRTADLLPWHGAADVTRLSPLEVTARLLGHIREAWNHQFPGCDLAEQDVVLTIPASFDEIARELTVQAAARAGLPRVVLLEEPQAAFYAWIHKHHDQWHRQVCLGQTILVCDVGGGTSDFTLIRVRPAGTAEAAQETTQGNAEGESRIQFHRVAVGNHLILGGDNLDLALARYVEQRLTDGGKLAANQWDVLVRQCQRVKEQMLAAEAPARWTVHLPGTGARLIGGGLSAELEQDEIHRLLIDGFLPLVDLHDKPRARQSGFQEFGLPYAADPAITRYLAAFLTAHLHPPGSGECALRESPADPVEQPLRPDVVLLNGGFFASPVLRERLIAQIAHWFQTPDDNTWSPIVLDNDRLDLAVARGAAYNAMVRRGEGVRIAANLARSYYIGIDSDVPTAVCLVPGSAEPGHDLSLTDQSFQLRISQPVEFPLWVSSTRLTDRPGQLVAIDREQMTPLPPIRTVLRTRSRRETGTIRVQLHARLTDIGTIDLWCSDVDRDRSWRLQFDIRSATQTDRTALETRGEREGVLDEQTWDRCRVLIAGVFAPSGTHAPASLLKRLAVELDCAKHQWPTPLLRRIWEALMEFESGRRCSADHESRWLNLVGFSLRPGYGLAVDDWRVAETWRTVQGKLAHGGASVRNEALVLWRRIAGGLSRGQQQALADPLLASVRQLGHRHATGKTRGDDTALRPNELSEILRLLGSLELLDIARKIELGDILSSVLPKRKLEAVRGPIIWTLGRLGQRCPVYGPLNTVVPSEVAARWLPEVIRHSADDLPTATLAIMQLARRTDDRYRDLPPTDRREAVMWLEDQTASPHLIELVRDGGALDADEQQQVFGESLPKGLRLERS